MAREMLGEAYRELDLESKFELMPLFFAPDMESEKSIYLSEGKIRDSAFKAFQYLTKKDELEIEDLREQYKINQEYAYLLPIAEHLKER